MKSWKKLIVGILAATLVFACFFLARTTTLFLTKTFAIRGMASAQVAASPFVLQTEIYSFSNKADGELMARKTEARRADGATVLVVNVGPISWGQTARRIIYMDGRSVSVLDSLETKTTWPTTPRQDLASFKAQFLQPSGNCVRVGQTLLGYGKLLSQDVAIMRDAPPFGPNGEARQFTFWKAPTLACQTLEYRVDDKQPDGSWKLITEARAVSLSLEEPDPRLFDVPSSYTEVKPSEVQHRLFQKVGLAEDAEHRKQIELQDSLYLGR